MPPPWQCSRPGWTGLWAAWSSGRHPCPRQRGWNKMICKVPSSLHCSMIWHVPSSPAAPCCWRLPTAQTHADVCEPPLGAGLAKWIKFEVKSTILFHKKHNCSPDQPLMQSAAWAHNDTSQHRWGSKWVSTNGMGRDFLHSCQSFWSHNPVKWALHGSVKPWLHQLSFLYSAVSFYSHHTYLKLFFFHNSMSPKYMTNIVWNYLGLGSLLNAFSGFINKLSLLYGLILGIFCSSTSQNK